MLYISSLARNFFNISINPYIIFHFDLYFQLLDIGEQPVGGKEAKRRRKQAGKIKIFQTFYYLYLSFQRGDCLDTSDSERIKIFIMAVDT